MCNGVSWYGYNNSICITGNMDKINRCCFRLCMKNSINKGKEC